MRDMIKARLRLVAERIERACERARRNPQDIRLIAVTKQFGFEVVESAIEAGLSDFGENYAQELQRKAFAIEQKGLHPRWHFIGALQTNKAKIVANICQSIHSVDKKGLLQEMERRIPEGKVMDCFIEVNIGDEPQKSGASEALVLELARLILSSKKMRLLGLMCVPPFSEDPEASRPYFQKLRRLEKSLQERLSPPPPLLRGLSMGMSHDLEVAIEEGATVVRVGTAIFGERRKN
jgi:pyridoxal phosphate enzyme (YggS family)